MVPINHSAKEFTVKAGDCIAQLILDKIETPVVKKVLVMGDTKCGAEETWKYWGAVLVSLNIGVKGRKEKEILSPEPGMRQGQARGLLNVLVILGPVPSNQNQLG